MTSLSIAAGRGDVQSCAKLLSSGADVNQVDGQLRSPLFYAANGGHVDCVELLLGAGARLNDGDQDGSTALQKAVINGNAALVDLLLANGADPCWRENQQRTCMHFCAHANNLDIARLLLRAGARLDEPDQELRTPLHWAVFLKHLDFCRWLLAEGCHIDACDEKGKTPLFYAVLAHDLAVVICLVEFGANVRHLDSEGRSVVDVARASNFLECVDYLADLAVPSSPSASSSTTVRRRSLSAHPPAAKQAVVAKRRAAVAVQQQKENVAERHSASGETNKNADDEHDDEDSRLEAKINAVLTVELQRTQQEIADTLALSGCTAGETDRSKQIGVLTALLQAEQRRKARYATLIQQMASGRGAEQPAVSAKPTLVRRTVDAAAQEKDNELLRRQQAAMMQELQRLGQQLEGQQASLKACEQENRELKRQLGEHFRTPAQLRSALDERRDSRARAAQLARGVAALRGDLHALRSGVTSWRSAAMQQIEQVRAAVWQMHERKNGKGIQAMRLYRQVLEERKQLWNQLQDLKGAIRVFCRIRPAADADSVAVAPSSVHEGQVTIVHGGKKRRFEFDRVFGPRASQEDVFEDTKPLVRSVVDGFNVCIFAYGQTGSGKTYTMQGTPAAPGVMTRALLELFTLTDSRVAEGYSYTIDVSIVELYNEKIFCLLSSPEHSRASHLDVRQSPDGDGMEVVGAVRVPVASAADIEAVLTLGAKNRSTGTTNLNEHSSRSHLLLLIRVVGANRVTGERHAGKLTLVDLAGSERLDKAGTSGAAAKETAAINASLSALGNVVSALQRKEPNAHIPYRNSKLTYLLQDSLGAGSSKTLMFIQADARATNAAESNLSLQFAERVRSVQLTPQPGRRPAAQSSSSSSSSR